MVKIVLFDLDGTITDSGPGIMNSVQYALDRFGYEDQTEEQLRRFIGPPLIDSFREFYGLSEEHGWQAVALYREYYGTKGIFENTLYRGVPEMLDRLTALGCKTAIATSKPEVYAVRILEHLGISDKFAYIGGSLMNGDRSRKAEVITYVMDKLDCQEPGTVMMVGDRRHDIEGAHLVGIDATGVTYGYGSCEELLKANADYLAVSPERFVKVIEVLNQTV
ncbi:MAG: HAD hydrolase-like protein [Mogibacterium sp.]|nr:HAD hydrolase-like protein [Mogibacterium sp.]